SFNYFGNDQARYQLFELLISNATDNNNTVTNITNPCAPSNFSEIYAYNGKKFKLIGSSDSEECFKVTKELLNLDKPCKVKNCSFDGVYTPELSGKFYGFSGYFIPFDFFNITSKS